MNIKMKSFCFLFIAFSSCLKCFESQSTLSFNDELANSFLKVAENLITKAKEHFPTCYNTQLDSSPKPLDCEELKDMGNTENGIYTIWPKSRIFDDKPIEVYCDMHIDEGGWTLIQRRGNFLMPKDYFFQDWSNYKTGFGDLNKEFWLGNDNIFALTNQRLYSVRFDMMDISGEIRYALYDRFWIDDEDHNYTLHIKEYSGDAGDAMFHHDNQLFSTKDRDHDNDTLRHCAQLYKGGWWYNACHNANLNGLNLRGIHTELGEGINWNPFRFLNESMETTEIKIRPRTFRKSSSKAEVPVNSNQPDKTKANETVLKNSANTDPYEKPKK